MKRKIKFRAWIPDTGWLADGFSIAMDGTEWYDDNGHSWQLSQLELMQFTGLKDKNGVEIYEGDIISDGYDNAVVYYDTSRAAFMSQFKIEDSPQEFEENFIWFTIVGNIHENPELL